METTRPCPTAARQGSPPRPPKPSLPRPPTASFLGGQGRELPPYPPGAGRVRLCPLLGSASCWWNGRGEERDGAVASLALEYWIEASSSGSCQRTLRPRRSPTCAAQGGPGRLVLKSGAEDKVRERNCPACLLSADRGHEPVLDLYEAGSLSARASIATL
jgi:hypothetical protein